jgi:hypothetical protein
MRYVSTYSSSYFSKYTFLFMLQNMKMPRRVIQSVQSKIKFPDRDSINFVIWLQTPEMSHPPQPTRPTMQKTSIRFFPLALFGSNLISPLCQITDGCHRLCFKSNQTIASILNHRPNFFLCQKMSGCEMF